MSVKGDLLLTTVALLVVGGLCVKGITSFNRMAEMQQPQKMALLHEKN